MVWVFAVCVSELASARGGEMTAFCPGDGVCVSRLCLQDVGTGGVAPTGSAVPLPAGDASATDAAADAVRVQTRECGCEGAAREGSVSLGGLLRDAMRV